jgi:hypothetical protein
MAATITHRRNTPIARSIFDLISRKFSRRFPEPEADCFGLPGPERRVFFVPLLWDVRAIENL